MHGVEMVCRFEEWSLAAQNLGRRKDEESKWRKSKRTKLFAIGILEDSESEK